MKDDKEIIGLDLIDEKPDYTKSFQENEAIRAERLKKLQEEHVKENSSK